MLWSGAIIKITELNWTSAPIHWQKDVTTSTVLTESQDGWEMHFLNSSFSLYHDSTQMIMIPQQSRGLYAPSETLPFLTVYITFCGASMQSYQLSYHFCLCSLFMCCSTSAVSVYVQYHFRFKVYKPYYILWLIMFWIVSQHISAVDTAVGQQQLRSVTLPTQGS